MCTCLAAVFVCLFVLGKAWRNKVWRSIQRIVFNLVLRERWRFVVRQRKHYFFNSLVLANAIVRQSEKCKVKKRVPFLGIALPLHALQRCLVFPLVTLVRRVPNATPSITYLTMAKFNLNTKRIKPKGPFSKTRTSQLLLVPRYTVPKTWYWSNSFAIRGRRCCGASTPPAPQQGVEHTPAVPACEMMCSSIRFMLTCAIMMTSFTRKVRSSADRCYIPQPSCEQKLSDAEGVALIGNNVSSATQEIFVGYDSKPSALERMTFVAANCFNFQPIVQSSDATDDDVVDSTSDAEFGRNDDDSGGNGSMLSRPTLHCIGVWVAAAMLTFTV